MTAVVTEPHRRLSALARILRSRSRCYCRAREPRQTDRQTTIRYLPDWAVRLANGATLSSTGADDAAAACAILLWCTARGPAIPECRPERVAEPLEQGTGSGTVVGAVRRISALATNF